MRKQLPRARRRRQVKRRIRRRMVEREPELMTMDARGYFWVW